MKHKNINLNFGDFPIKQFYNIKEKVRCVYIKLFIYECKKYLLL